MSLMVVEVCVWQLMSVHDVLYFLYVFPTFSSNTATVVHLP